MNKSSVMLVIAGGFCASIAQAGVVTLLSDNFNTENGGNGVLNYAGFANWNVSDGTVDLIGNGYFDFLPGNGLYVDMDGSTGNAGAMETKAAFDFDAAKRYRVSFRLAGNQRNNNPDSVSVRIVAGLLLNQTISLSKNDPFTTFTYTFNGDDSTGQKIRFEATGGDNIGMLFDDFTLQIIPLPSASALAGLGLLGLGVRRRRGSL